MKNLQDGLGNRQDEPSVVNQGEPSVGRRRVANLNPTADAAGLASGVARGVILQTLD